ncbi:lanthionine synthetase LanC family protein [Janthinobacterium sp. PAMC25594]|uniref:lanthionine synthetase LanC family protein n=1 Tax=Janthinobacterium sp. PAMC25594 TaxID=2861284 RepID=UPI001C62B55C|nr:lanthionine synthetase LanC family protein [Janthinobacterium sp. PAMC25594]QYG06802.1 hypothetical protein KY494_26850 [Janthinobacterium sp. PAMC25594]
MKIDHYLLEKKCFIELLSRPKNVCLADGVAGALLLESQLYSQAPSKERRENIVKVINILIHSIQFEPLEIGLWIGLTGILYSIEFTRSICPELVSPEVQTFVSEMDEHLINYLDSRKNDLNFDLISGTVGIGAYALMRTDIIAARRIYSSVERSLITSSEHVGNGRIWRSNMPRSSLAFTPGITRIDLGLAHGLPGVVLLMAGAVKHTLATEITQNVLQEAVVALIGYQAEQKNGSKYPYFDPQHEWAGSRLGWCYGDLGVGFAIASAGSATSNQSWINFGKELVEQRISQPTSTFLISDNSLCHGRSGVLHILKKLKQYFSIEDYTFVAEWIAHDTEKDSVNDSLASYGLLEGMTGVLISLYDNSSQERQHWDTCLCLGF